MAKSNRGSRSRGEITQSVDQRKGEYEEKTDALKHDAEDVGTEREAIEGMEGLGTIEGMEAVTESLREAEATSQREFADDGGVLEQSQREGQELEGELDERAESTDKDLREISEARGEVHSDAAAGPIERAEAQTREDIEFLRGEEERGRESREKAEQEHEQLKQIVHGKGS